MGYLRDRPLPLPHYQVRNNWIYIVLGIILIASYIWQEYDNGVMGKWHVFYSLEYPLYWYIVLTSWALRPFLYVIVAALAKSRHKKLLIVFMIYEGVMFLDFILIYSQSDVRRPIAIVLAVYMIWYHYKYENIGWIG